MLTCAFADVLFGLLPVVLSQNQGVRCPDLNIPTNGEMSCDHGHSFHYPETCSFSCDRTYQLAPGSSSSRTCQADGTWSGNPVRCIVYASCAALKDDGYDTSGSYVIDPDGPDYRAEPFSVYCDFPRGTTVVSHDSEDRTAVLPECDPAGCYERKVNYQATLEQLSALAAVSRSCKQNFTYECYHSSFGVPPNDLAWWTSRDGQEKYNWSGLTSSRRTCACGESGSCAIPSISCNCDMNDKVWRKDSGFITDKNNLPVIQLNFGDTGYSFEHAFHTLGKFMCEGTNH
ncbi:contactin-associated protein-like 2 [Branchiostoma floridae x Branchiostoma japonicum]